MFGRPKIRYITMFGRPKIGYVTMFGRPVLKRPSRVRYPISVVFLLHLIASLEMVHYLADLHSQSDLGVPHHTNKLLTFKSFVYCTSDNL